MAPLTTAEDVFELIDKKAVCTGIIKYGPSKFIPFVRSEMLQAQAQYPFMKDVTPNDFFDYVVRRDERARAANLNAIPMYTAEDFWNAAYDFDPLSPTATPDGTQLAKIAMSGRLQCITLGKIYGHTTLKLIPALGTLPATETPNFRSPFDYAITDSGAIYYPDGHPLEDIFGADLSMDSSQNTGPHDIRATDDDTLRRFAALGWVAQERPWGGWEKTGHILVMDMDDKSIRDRQPWMILASEWPTDGDETLEGTFSWHAKETVWRDDNTEAGVFLGDDNRTPICSIRPIGPSENIKGPILKQFGEAFQFEPICKAGHRSTKPSRYGPALAHVMDWYWDPDAKQEVCYTRGGLEYMRYDPQTKQYSFPDFSKMSFGGEQGLFGELEENATLEVPSRFVSLEQRLRQGMSLTSAPHLQRRRLMSSSKGF